MIAWDEQRDYLLPVFHGLLTQGEVHCEKKEEFQKAFEAIRLADRDAYAPALKNFLMLLAPESAWFLEFHALLDAIVDFGCSLAKRHSYYGLRYFTTLAQGGFGKSPEQVEQLLKWLRKSFALDEKLVPALLRGYQRLSERLGALEVDRYIEEGLTCHEINRQMSERFLALDLENSEAVIRNLACECRLIDVVTELERLLLALTGRKISVESLNALPSAASLKRRPRIVMMQRQLYLPARINRFPSKKTNRRWYLLLAVMGAAMLDFKSFPCLHGLPDYPSAKSLIGDSFFEQNVFQIVEFVRVLKASQDHWPGCRHVIRSGLEDTFRQDRFTRSGAEELFFDLLGSFPFWDTQSKAIFLDQRWGGTRCHEQRSMLTQLKGLAERSTHLFETFEQISHLDRKLLLQRYPDLNEILLRPLAFLPDFFYPGYLQASSPGEDLMNENAAAPEYAPLLAQKRTRYESVPGQPQILEKQHAGVNDDEGQTRCYVHDEWSHNQHCYLRGHCYVYERQVESRREISLSKTLQEEGNKLRQVFEMLRPDESRKETRLPEGDTINESLLVEYMIQARREPSPKVNFFERPRTQTRDIAVLLLLDLSGSTREQVNETRVIDIEKQAAVIFGQGLAALGDRFAICGFSSDGRERCEFLSFKAFDDSWNRQSQARVLAARPMQNTRMGAALRHAGYRLSQLAARQKLIMLFSDGQPLDRGYDPQHRYAQHDVRMACLENKGLGIVTFCLSTLENSRQDMELMFPDQRYVILHNIKQLSRILPRMYMKLTL